MEIIIVDPVKESVIRDNSLFQENFHSLPAGIGVMLLSLLKNISEKAKAKKILTNSDISFILLETPTGNYPLGNLLISQEEEEEARATLSLLVWYKNPHFYSLSRAIGADVKCADCGQLQPPGYIKYCCNPACPSHEKWKAING